MSGFENNIVLIFSLAMSLVFIIIADSHGSNAEMGLFSTKVVAISGHVVLACCTLMIIGSIVPYAVIEGEGISLMDVRWYLYPVSALVAGMISILLNVGLQKEWKSVFLHLLIRINLILAIIVPLMLQSADKPGKGGIDYFFEPTVELKYGIGLYMTHSVTYVWMISMMIVFVGYPNDPWINMFKKIFRRK
ncbi:MAG: hypothetical protein GY940_02250 [bacterium]|nr:hypothetical protein [bacterium]